MPTTKAAFTSQRANSRSIAFACSLGALILLAFGLRAFHLGVQDIWWDEGRNIFTASRPLAAIASAPELDIHPPLYFYLMHFWLGLVGTGEFTVRFFSLVFGVATVPLLYRLGTYVKDRPVGWWAAFFIALAPLLVDEAQQTRMYTLLLWLSTLSVYLLLCALETGQRKFWSMYALAAAAAFYTHYSFVYVLAVQNLYLAYELLRRERARRALLLPWAGSQLAIAFLYLFQVPNILRQMQIYGNPSMTTPTLPQYVSELAVALTLGQKVEPTQTAVFGLAFVAALALGLVGAVLNRQDALTLRGGLFVVMWFVLPLIGYYIVLQKSPQFTPRYILIAIVPFYLFLSLLFGKISRLSRWLGAFSAVILLLVFAGGWSSFYFNPSFFTDDTKGLARFVSAEATKDDIVLIDVPFPFDYYYHGPAQARYLPVDIHNTADVLTRELQNKRRVFVIHWFKSDTDPRGYLSYLMDKYAVFQGGKEFRGYEVMWYTLPGQPSFSLAEQPQPAAAPFGDQVMLTAFAYGGAAPATSSDVNAPRVAQKGKLWVALWWITMQPVVENYKVSVVLRDAAGNTVAQDDRMLISDRHYKTSLWTPLKETAINVYTLGLDEGVKAGEYTLYAIVYNPETGKRLAVAAGDSFMLGPLQVVP